MSGLVKRLLAAGLFVLAAGCEEEAEPRPQLELFIDVDMVVPSQLESDELSPDAAVDTLRIEVLTSDRELVDARIFTLTSPEALPLSLGIPSSVATNGKVLVRVRAFRAIYSSPGRQEESAVLDPIQQVTIDRLVELELPSEGFETRSVTLHGECMGTPSRFSVGDQPNRTCVDADRLEVDASEGIDTSPSETSSAGSWARARFVPCTTEPPEGTVCIHGGLTILGDPLFLPRSEYEESPLPLRVAFLSPFFMDVTEATVGRIRDEVAAGYDGPLPESFEERAGCSWETEADLPVNCINYAVADGICAAREGTVPTEAQWEYVARGRGERRTYPWGSQAPTCCMTSIGRVDGMCPDSGLEPVGSHLGTEDCLGDVSYDGVIDMAGSVAELTRDSIASFADECWAPPKDAPQILEDPVCEAAVGRMARGASWRHFFGDAPVPIRRTFAESSTDHGFRCVYQDGT